MTTKEQIKYKIDLTSLAKDKGFESTFLHGKPYLHSNKEPLRWLFWKTELKQWVQEQIKMYIAFYPDTENFDDVIISMLKTLPDV